MSTEIESSPVSTDEWEADEGVKDWVLCKGRYTPERCKVIGETQWHRRVLAPETTYPEKHFNSQEEELLHTLMFDAIRSQARKVNPGASNPVEDLINYMDWKLSTYLPQYILGALSKKLNKNSTKVWVIQNDKGEYLECGNPIDPSFKWFNFLVLGWWCLSKEIAEDMIKLAKEEKQPYLDLSTAKVFRHTITRDEEE